MQQPEPIRQWLQRLPLVDGLAFAGALYSAADTVVATAVLDANFLLFNTAKRSGPIYIFAAQVSVTAAMEIDVFTLNADPGLAGGSTPTNFLLEASQSSVNYEAAAAATPATESALNKQQVAASFGIADLIGPGVLILPPGRGVLVSSAKVAGSVSCRFVWGEANVSG